MLESPTSKNKDFYIIFIVRRHTRSPIHIQYTQIDNLTHLPDSSLDQKLSIELRENGERYPSFFR